MLGTICLVFLISQSAEMGEAQAGRSAQKISPQRQAKVRSQTKSNIHAQRGQRLRPSRAKSSRLPRLRNPATKLGKRGITAFQRTKGEQNKLKKSALKPASKKQSRPKANKLKSNKLKPNKLKPNKLKATSKKQGKLKAKKAKPSKLKTISKAIGKKIAKFKKRPAVKRMLQRIAKASAAVTRKLDRMQARAPPWLAKSMNALRTYSIVSLAAFNLTYLKRDAKFLGTFFATNAVVSYGVLPAAVTIGLDPLTSTLLNALSTPVTIAVLILRDRHLKLKAGKETTLAQSARAILSDYKDFATKRRQNTSASALAMASH